MLKSVRESFRIRRSVSSSVTFGSQFLVGRGSRVWAPQRLDIGNDVSIGSGVRIEVDGSIGDGVLIANGAAIVGRSDHDLHEIGTSIRRATWVGEEPERLSRRTHVGSDVWVGFGAIVMSGVRIGDSAIVGAGSIVVHDVEPNTIVAGVPARPVKSRFSSEDFEEHWRLLRISGVRSTSD